MKYGLEVKLDDWDNDSIYFESTVPFQNINIGDLFSTHEHPKNMSEFDKVGYFKIIDKIHYIGDNRHKVGILLKTSTHPVDVVMAGLDVVKTYR